MYLCWKAARKRKLRNEKIVEVEVKVITRALSWSFYFHQVKSKCLTITLHSCNLLIIFMVPNRQLDSQVILGRGKYGLSNTLHAIYRLIELLKFWHWLVFLHWFWTTCGLKSAISYRKWVVHIIPWYVCGPTCVQWCDVQMQCTSAQSVCTVQSMNRSVLSQPRYWS